MNLDFVKTPFTNNPSMVRHEGMAYNLKPNQEYLEQKKKQKKYLIKEILVYHG